MQWSVWYLSATDLIYFDHVIADRSDQTVPNQYKAYLAQLWDRVAKSLNTSRQDTTRDKLLYQALIFPIVMYGAGGRRDEFAAVFQKLRTGAVSVADIPADELDIVLRSGVRAGDPDDLTFVLDTYYVPLLIGGGPGSPDDPSPFSIYQILVSRHNIHRQCSSSQHTSASTSVTDSCLRHVVCGWCCSPQCRVLRMMH